MDAESHAVLYSAGCQCISGMFLLNKFSFVIFLKNMYHWKKFLINL